MLSHTEEGIAVALGFGGFISYPGQPKVLSLWKRTMEAVYDRSWVVGNMYSFYSKEAESRRSWPTMVRIPIRLLLAYRFLEHTADTDYTTY